MRNITLDGRSLGPDDVTAVLRGAEFTGAHPGTILRSGRDTETVPLSG